MGYDSTFSGSLRPSRPIPKKLARRINGACDLRVADKYDDCDCDIGDIIPAARTMHGYCITEDVFKVQRLLAGEGIVLNGTIYRKGDDDEDFQMIEAVKGRIYTRAGEVVFGKRFPVTADSVTQYAIRAVKPASGKRNPEIVGWAARKYCTQDDMYTDTVVAPRPGKGKARYCTPPLDAMTLKNRAVAMKLASRLNKTGDLTYEVVTLEDRL